MQSNFLKNDSRLYCFTPLVSLATFFIEIFLAFYILFRYRRTPFIVLSAILLFLLGIFQLSEYMMCQTSDIIFWGKIGSASITLLPVIGLHIVSFLTRKTRWIYPGYFVSFLMILGIFFLPFLVIDIRCTGKFVILNPGNLIEIVYSIYYFFFLFISLEMLIRSLQKNNAKRQNILWMIAAYLSFIIPTALIVILFALSYNAVPSIMCGFAIILAFIIAFKEVPLFFTASKKSNRKKKKRKP